MDNVMRELLDILKSYKQQIVRPTADPSEVMISFIEKERTALESGIKSGSISPEGRREKSMLIKLLDKLLPLIAGKTNADAFKAIKAEFDKTVKETKKLAQQAENGMSNALLFCEGAFGEGQEILILITELTSNTHTAQFIAKFGCKEYFKHNKELLFYDRQQELLRQIAELDELYLGGYIYGILKDDLTIGTLLDSFTLPQIMSFIDLATKNNCTNATAVLLNYRNEHYPEYDGFAALDDLILDDDF